MASHPTIELVLKRIDHGGLWSIQGNRETSLADFETALFGASAEVGNLLQGEALCLLRLWPHQAYLRAEQAPLPASVQKYARLVTDLSDGYCEFRLVGELAFDFVADYLSADLAQQSVGPACLRCRLGHFVVILWWDEQRELRLLVERSCAQSFADYIDTLMARWRPETP